MFNSDVWLRTVTLKSMGFFHVRENFYAVAVTESVHTSRCYNPIEADDFIIQE